MDERRHTFTQVIESSDITGRITSVKFINVDGRELSTRGALPKVACSQCDFNKIGDKAIMIGKAIKVCSQQRAPCSDKCTGASGPSCDCSCGGENHGGVFDLNQRVVA